MPDEKKRQESGSKTDDLAQAGLKRLEEFGLGAYAVLGSKWLEIAAEMNSEMLNFIAERVHQDVSAQQAMMQSSSIDELHKAQLEFWEKAYIQYTVEAGKLMELGMGMLPVAAAQTKNEPV